MCSFIPIFRYKMQEFVIFDTINEFDTKLVD